MKLRSYLRGIGAGLIVAALVMGFAAPKASDADENNSRETIRETASSVSAQVSAIPEAEPDVSENEPAQETTGTEDVSADETETPVVTDTTGNDVTDENKETDTSAETTATDVSSNEETETISADTEEKTPAPINPLEDGDTGYTQNEESVDIKIVKGDSSVTVARRLYEAGLVESAAKFNTYLCNNGYDKSIRVGTFTIDYSLKDDYEALAKKISRKK